MFACVPFLFFENCKNGKEKMLSINESSTTAKQL